MSEIEVPINCDIFKPKSISLKHR